VRVSRSRWLVLFAIASQGGALAGFLVGYGGPAINTDPNCTSR
jgi:hypothetical protein